MPTALIIGASRGIGLGLTAELIARGWQVVATHRSAAPELVATGATTAVVDMDDAESVAALAAAHAGTMFDHILINAGISSTPTASTTDKDNVTKLFWTNAIAPIRAARILLPLVKDGGSIGFMTSILGTVGGRQHGYAELYSASKAALNSLTRGFAVQDVGSRNIAVINFHPGWVKTDMGGDGADIDVATSVQGLATQIETVKPPGQHYIDYTGKTIPW
ncbi:SDR family NAD(P)-dependent oxidoreductase [Sandarakinorhabdus sp.]|uniref:SDR family NAD(P)-dependent oxidoreductase n=1 Tax=Sandarakinorhabdus sp. TaxID=1916663 RepID=UPI003F6F6BE6